MFSGMFGALGGGFFDQNFRAYPVAFIEKESAEGGDKVILPPSSLNKLGPSTLLGNEIITGRVSEVHLALLLALKQVSKGDDCTFINM